MGTNYSFWLENYGLSVNEKNEFWRSIIFYFIFP
jgi:hypothetical protein